MAELICRFLSKMYELGELVNSLDLLCDVEYVHVPEEALLRQSVLLEGTEAGDGWRRQG